MVNARARIPATRHPSLRFKRIWWCATVMVTLRDQDARADAREDALDYYPVGRRRLPRAMHSMAADNGLIAPRCGPASEGRTPVQTFVRRGSEASAIDTQETRTEETLL